MVNHQFPRDRTSMNAPTYIRNDDLSAEIAAVDVEPVALQETRYWLAAWFNENGAQVGPVLVNTPSNSDASARS